MDRLLPRVPQRATCPRQGIFRNRVNRKIRSAVSAQLIPQDRQARVGSVTFDGQKSDSNEPKNGHQHTEQAAAKPDVPNLIFRVGSLNGEASRGMVTFRSEIPFLKVAGKWHMIPEKYDGLPEREMQRRMKIKVINSGKIPWNRGKKWDPAQIEQIRSATLKAMQRDDVKAVYAKKMEIHKFIKEPVYEKRRLLKKAEKEKMRAAERERRANQPKVKRKRPSRRKPPTSKSTTPRKPGPMAEEQKRRISESIRKKWMDPEYRNAVLRSKERYLARRIANGYVPKTRRQRRREKRFKEKYEVLMTTINKLTTEIRNLEFQKSLVAADPIAVRHIDAALDRSQELIQRVREAVKEVEEKLGVTAPVLHPTDNVGQELELNSENGAPETPPEPSESFQPDMSDVLEDVSEELGTRVGFGSVSKSADVDSC